MEQIVVGEIEGYDVLYIPERDIVFCKNTTIPYKVLKRILFEDTVDRVELKKDLMFYSNKNSISFGCLTTTLENCKLINKNIKIISDIELVFNPGVDL